jgi:hypothetical protein
LDGNFFSSWFSFYDFFNSEVEMKFENEERFEIFKQTTKLSFIYPLFDKKVCVLCQKPTKICFNKNNQLHNESGPAIEYAGIIPLFLYSLNGVSVTKEIVEPPWNKLNSKLILTEKNAEVRKEIVRKIGSEKLCSDLKAKVIDKKDEYELLLLDLKDGRNRPYLKMKNPSIGVYHIEGVHPDCKTVEDALNFRSGLKEWKPEFMA